MPEATIQRTQNTFEERLAHARACMRDRNIDGLYIPRTDKFQGEYIPPCAEHLKWISGFTGSAGAAILLRDKAAFFTDGRYTIQARAQVDANHFKIYSISPDQGATPTLAPHTWLENNLPKGATFGIDPWLHTPDQVEKLRTAVESAGGTLVFCAENPLDAAWINRPPPPATPAVAHPLSFSGVDSAEKRQHLARKLAASGADALVIALPEEICWLLNVRGNDVPCTPFVLSYAIAHADTTLDWFVDAAKICSDTRAWVGADVRLHPLEDIIPSLARMAQSGKNIWLDTSSAPAALHAVLAQNNAQMTAGKSPIQLMKACKNKTEIQGAINAHIRDGVAVTRFLAALSTRAQAAAHDELTAETLLENFRHAEDLFKGPSFDTISGAGGNGAIVHYRATPETCRPLLDGPVYLVDSGGQYLDGTTDITRTIVIDPDNLTDEMKDRYTRVLKGHIQVAMSKFPAGTTGDALDKKARAALQQAGLDYAHGTGHGVGSYLSVHEGPCGISPMAKTVALLPGMIISNEPGFYAEGAYGIRIESLVTVINTGETDKDGVPVYGFQTLTMAPIDTRPVIPDMLDNDERAWLNAYHATVRATLSPLLREKDAAADTFLNTATAAI